MRVPPGAAACRRRRAPRRPLLGPARGGASPVETRCAVGARARESGLQRHGRGKLLLLSGVAEAQG